MDFALELGMATRARQDLAGRAQRFSVRLLRVVADLLRDATLPRRVVEQLAAAGTAIGFNLSEAQSSISRRQMAHCYTVALRECRETSHALGILRELGKGDPAEVAWLLGEVHEFTAMLVVSVRKLRDPAP